MVRRADCRVLDGILLLDKPLGCSSNQALQQVRRLFQARKAGHTGSLDPLATGMLPICFGQATKLSGLLLDSNKEYLARARIGQKTLTGDAEGEVVQTSDPSGLSLDDFARIRDQFLGRILQVPPMYSALKQGGQRLYELARKGESVERAAREVVIHSLDLISYDEGELVVAVRCSKGTYIRTLLEDIAAAVGQVAHLTALRRTQVDPFPGGSILSLEALQDLAGQGMQALDDKLLPLKSAVPEWPEAALPDSQLARLASGQAARWPEALPPKLDGDIAIVDGEGSLCAAGRQSAEGQLVSRKWLSSRIFA
tara:strand:+ start:758 stop:1690 length:933 start_codon:yes stop_codon:yes gene_type:complete